MPAKDSLAARPMAFLSDVHGNLRALNAVLEDLERREISAIFVAGDLLFGGDEPLEVWKRLREVDARCVRGLSDTALFMVDPNTLSPGNDEERSMADRFISTRKLLGDLVVERIRRMPERLRIPMVDGSEIVMVHGSPSDPSREITHDMEDREIAALIDDDPADIVVCGGSHVPFRRELEGVFVVNVGSVGAAPEGRTAHYTILTPHLDRTDITQEWTEY